MNSCLNCSKDTINPKFCSRSCSAILNNKIFPKKIKYRKWFCVTCNNYCKPRNKFCEEHKTIKKIEYMTIKDYKEKLSVRGKHPSWANAHIRTLARSRNKDLISKPCFLCGYTKHVEICHIKPLKEFPETALIISEVNNKTNLIQLCPNCHWEFDNNLVKLIL